MSSIFNIEYIQALVTVDADVKGLIERKTVSSQENFVETLYKDIDEAIRILEQDRHFYQGPEYHEDHITSCIITFLKGRCYDAEHDTQHGGHCDILVKSSVKSFEWIGEAKLWKGVQYIHGGFKQLTRRYATGTFNDSYGGVLVYVKQTNTKSKTDEWKAWIESNLPTLGHSDEANSLRFRTSHTHVSSGLPYNVRHMFVVLNHETSIEPEYDESGNPI